MKNGKYSVSSFAKLKGKRRMVAALALVLILICTVGGTLAYVFTHSGSVENTFTPSKVTTAVVENVNGEETERAPVDGGAVEKINTKSNVKIKNTGETEAYIRATVVVTWKKIEMVGNQEVVHVYAMAPTCDFNSATNWIAGADGYYYYNEQVAPGQTTAELIKGEPRVTGTAPEGYFLSVEIVASGIQSTPDSVVSAEWDNDKVDVTGNNGTLTVTSKQGG